MFGLGTTELILILVIVMVLFGAKKLPALGEGLAKGIKSFRTNISIDEKDKDDDKTIDVEVSSTEKQKDKKSS
ncbi:twin-arginine translocase TatA/TatE family subunit [Ghiorsea bivora]|uniref:twin-arginine translocase TatA/TatE family subunit n=1 Tax=Ghiorsea bivora TaxID=1485545 RepID=UPI00056F3EFD|nr:twin-arginine translocase TatA/TatE family subunit [Ghiorsea bivora]